MATWSGTQGGPKTEKRFTVWGRRGRQASFEAQERDPKKLSEDLAIAFREIADLHIRTWVLTGVCGAAGMVIGWLADHLWDCIAAAHQVGMIITR
jgi:hypothetical protein